MGLRGPAKEPTYLKLMKGTVSEDQAAQEVQPSDAEPTRPESLSERACEVWDRVTAELRTMHMLKAADQDTLAVLCTAVEHWEMAAAEVNKHGILIGGPRGIQVKNPALQVVRDQGTLVRLIAREFGLTPSARVGFLVPEKTPDGASPERLLS